MTPERSEIQFGLTTIPFLVRRSNRRATVALTIEPPGRLVVTAPAETTIDKLNGVVRHKAPWVIQRIKRASDRPPASSDREFVTGETIYYLGRQYRLKLIPATPGWPEGYLRGGWLHVPIKQNLKGQARVRAARQVVLAWLREHADHYLPNRLDDLCTWNRLERPSVIVREQRKRWGSCDARGTLRINWRIVQAAVPLIDYVLLHELVHLQHPNHTRAFWAEVERLVPDYERRRQDLRRVGPAFEW